MPPAKANAYVFICTMTSASSCKASMSLVRLSLNIMTLSLAVFSDLSGYGDLFVMWLKTLAPGARSHPDPRMRWLCKMFIASAAMSQPCYTNDDWDWDAM